MAGFRSMSFLEPTMTMKRNVVVGAENGVPTRITWTKIEKDNSSKEKVDSVASRMDFMQEKQIPFRTLL